MAFASTIVRGPNTNQPPRFLDNQDGTVTDTVSNLMWPKTLPSAITSARPQSTVDAGINLLNSSRFLGYNDWRLPEYQDEAWQSVPRVAIGSNEIDTLFSGIPIDRNYWVQQTANQNNPYYLASPNNLNPSWMLHRSHKSNVRAWIWPVRTVAGKTPDYYNGGLRWNRAFLSNLVPRADVYARAKIREGFYNRADNGYFQINLLQLGDRFMKTAGEFRIQITFGREKRQWDGYEDAMPTTHNIQTANNSITVSNMNLGSALFTLYFKDVNAEHAGFPRNVYRKKIWIGMEYSNKVSKYTIS